MLSTVLLLGLRGIYLVHLEAAESEKLFKNKERFEIFL